MVRRWHGALLVGCAGLAVLAAGAALRDGRVGRRHAPAWDDHLRTVERALREGQVSAAVRAWHDAYGAALGDRGWQSMLGVGAAYVAIGHARGAASGARPTARRAYLTALVRARRDRSVDGLLRVTEAFAALGDREVAEQCLQLAESLARGDAGATERVRASGVSLGLSAATP